jgi:hypothetical protein
MLSLIASSRVRFSSGGLPSSSRRVSSSPLSATFICAFCSAVISCGWIGESDARRRSNDSSRRLRSSVVSRVTRDAGIQLVSAPPGRSAILTLPSRTNTISPMPSSALTLSPALKRGARVSLFGVTGVEAFSRAIASFACSYV